MQLYRFLPATVAILYSSVSSACYGVVIYTSLCVIAPQIYIGNTLSFVDSSNAEQPTLSNLVDFAPTTRTFSIAEYSRRVFGGQYYWSLPIQFVGNKASVESWGYRKSMANNCGTELIVQIVLLLEDTKPLYL